METTKLSTKGQVILPKTIRDARQWKAGTIFSVEEVSGGVFLRPWNPFPETKLEAVAGCLKYSGRAKSLADMERAITKEIRERHGRGRY